MGKRLEFNVYIKSEASYLRVSGQFQALRIRIIIIRLGIDVGRMLHEYGQVTGHQGNIEFLDESVLQHGSR